MQRRNSATPCPVVGPSQFAFRPRDSLLSVCEETTTLEFTREFQNSLRSVKPRRRQTAVRQPRTSTTNFTIHEDEETRCDSTQRRIIQRRADGFGGSTLAQPPQRLGRRVSFAPETVSASQDHQKADGKDFSLIDRRLGMPNQVPSISYEESCQAALIQNEPKRILKPARRGTIYIPSDDTTMPSMYMGIFSPVQDLSNDKPDEFQPMMDLTGIAAKMAKKRGPRPSLAAAPPRRAPLQANLYILQESTIDSEIRGSGGGKENVPPGCLEVGRCKAEERDKLFDLSRPNASRRNSLMPDQARRKSFALPTCKSVEAQKDRVLTGEARSGLIFAPPDTKPFESRKTWKMTSQALGKQQQPMNVSTAKLRPVWNSGARPKSREAIVAPGPSSISHVQKQSSPVQKREKVPTKFVIPKIETEPLLERYPLLSEDICNAALYEENWLTHQEIAITQLVNNLFSASRNSNGVEDEALLRIKFLGIYQDPTFSILHTRLQASLLYGALRAPAETIVTEANRLKNDLGMRSQFTNLWLDTYSSLALKAALEVVVGRACKSTPKAISDFIATFLIRNEDATPDSAREAASWSYHRTLFRSLMLVRLLDEAKTAASTPVECLFKSASLYKSSAGFIQKLIQLLNPAIGDVIRALRQIEYHVLHVQVPLEEYEYHVANLAVDLRDGIKLTRLVELLLYPSASRNLRHEHDADATTTVIMPDGETLSLMTSRDQQQYPLSQHLKFPCLGRATKVFNVQVALSALDGVRGMETLVRDVKAEDIVDGYREKTVALLWGLTGRWGLGGLVDWEDVKGEIKRLRREGLESHEDETHDLADFDDEQGFGAYKMLLKNWAGAVARKKGLEVRNLSTSFADGRVFEAIVDEYEPFLNSLDTASEEARRISQTKRQRTQPLHVRLASLGCSVKFAQLFASTAIAPCVFDRTTTLAALAFLCSRLLSTSRRVRAARVLQRAWRRKWEKVIDKRKGVLKEVAEGCIDAVRAKERRVRAGKIILGAWRKYRERQLSPSNLDTQRGRNFELEIGRDDLSDDGEGDVWLSL